MKKAYICLFGLLLLNLISAAGYYGRFSINEMLGEINPNDMLLVVAFIVFFFFMNFVFSKVFKDKAGQPSRVAWVPAFALSLGATYYINFIDFNISGFFFNFGFSEDTLYTLIFFLVIALILFLLFYKHGEKSHWLIVLGTLIMVCAIFTEIFYRENIAILIGFIIFFLGVWRFLKHQKFKKTKFFREYVGRTT